MSTRQFFILSIFLISIVINADDSENAIIKNCKEITTTEKNDNNKTIYENCENILKNIEKQKKDSLQLEFKKKERKKDRFKLELEKRESNTTVKKEKKYDRIASMSLFMSAFPGLIIAIAPKIEFISGNFLVGAGIGYFGVAENSGGDVPDFNPTLGVLLNLGFNYSWDYFRVAITGEFNLGIPNHLTASIALTAGVKLLKFIEISGKIGIFTAGVNLGIHF